MLSEFELIDRCFRRPGRALRQTALGIGDDAALIRPTPGHELAVSTDLLVEGTHFLPDTDPEDLGWKTLAVNLSDMAAMGAQPRWATLAIALPGGDGAVPPGLTFSPSCGTSKPPPGLTLGPSCGTSKPPPGLTLGPSGGTAWIEAFARGFFACADAYGVDLVGGDTTRGPRAFSVTIFGELPVGSALRRGGARFGEDIWVSGTPGRAAMGLAALQGKLVMAEPQRAVCVATLQRPQPRVALGLALRGVASAAIDVSDGLLADLGHVLVASGVSASLRLPAAGPVFPAPMFDLQAFLAGGDDYELVFTAAPENDRRIAEIGEMLGLPLTRVGRVEAGTPGALRVFDATAKDITPARRGFDHFASRAD